MDTSAVLDYLRDNPGATCEELAVYFGVTKDTIRRCLRRLGADDLIYGVENYNKREPNRYYLIGVKPEPEPEPKVELKPKPEPQTPEPKPKTRCKTFNGTVWIIQNKSGYHLVVSDGERCYMRSGSLEAVVDWVRGLYHGTPLDLMALKLMAEDIPGTQIYIKSFKMQKVVR